MSAGMHELIRKLQQLFNDFSSPPIALAARAIVDKDGNVVFSADTASTTLAASAVGKEASSNKSTNVTTDGASDTKYPSAKAVKTYADAKSAAVVAALVAGLPTSDPAVAGRIWLNSGVLATSAGP